jgi:hypothetical protein
MSRTKRAAAILTNADELEAALLEHRNYWERAAYSTAPVNRSQVETYVNDFYQGELKCDPPKCVWIDSPRQAKRAVKGMEWDFDTRRIIDTKLNDAGVQAERDVASPPLDRIRKAFEQLRHPLHIGRRSRLWRWREMPNGGAHDNLRAFAFVDFFVTKIGWFKSLKPWLSVLASCNGIWFRKGTIVLMDTPEILHADDQARLHCENGPALRYRDGFEYYCLHGIWVPQQYVLTQADNISLTDVLQEPNAEVRLALINKVGFSRLVGTVRHWTISEAQGNSLIEFRIKGVQFVRALHVRWQDKTGQKETVIPVPTRKSEFGLDCPEDIDDCEQVRRWTLGWPKEAIAVAET